MIEQDTVRLLRECDAGCKMGVSSIDDVLDYVQADRLKSRLTACKAEHRKLEREIRAELEAMGWRWTSRMPPSQT